MRLEMAKEAFNLCDIITGIESGGIEAPRIMVKATRQTDGTVSILWHHPKTCGLSDCRYHYLDLAMHEDIYTLKGNVLLLNGKSIVLGVAKELFPESRSMILEFLERWHLDYPGISEMPRNEVISV